MKQVQGKSNFRMKTWACTLADRTGNSCLGGSCYLCMAGVKDRKKRTKWCPGTERGRLEKEPQGCLPTARLWVEEQTQIHKQNGILELRRERWGPPTPKPPTPAQPSQPQAIPQPSHTYRFGPWNPLPQRARQLLWAWEALALKQ